MTPLARIAACAAAALLSLTACGGGGGGSASASSGLPVVQSSAPGAPTSSGTTASASFTCPTAMTSSGPLDCTKLPLGDLKYSTTGAKQGYIYLCTTPRNGSPAGAPGPWLDTANGTWNYTQKIAVQGSVSYPGTFSETVNGTQRTIVSNGEPVGPETAGVFPIAASDPAYQYDRNPNHIAAQNDVFTLPADPTAAASPGCLSGGTIGITVTGVAIYDAFDAAGYDGVAHEIQDSCNGHPDQSSTYHMHGHLQQCVHDDGSPTQNSSLLGYALDGFGIYGPWYDGKILTSADLDACHGTTSPVMWDGKLVTMYHYVSTYDFPYTLGCYKGTPIKVGPGA